MENPALVPVYGRHAYLRHPCIETLQVHIVICGIAAAPFLREAQHTKSRTIQHTHSGLSTR